MGIKRLKESRSVTSTAVERRQYPKAYQQFIKRARQAPDHSPRLQSHNIIKWWLEESDQKSRKSVFKHEFEQARAQFLSIGARLLIKDGANYEDMLLQIIAGERLLHIDDDVDGVVRTLAWGNLDLRTLSSVGFNQWDDCLRLNQLVFGLALLLNQPRLNIVKVQKYILSKVGSCRVQKTSWRMGLFLLNHIDWLSYQGEEGYYQFAKDFFKGNLKVAHISVRSILSDKDFEELNWGKQKRGHVDDAQRVRDLLKLPKYKGEKGYDQFAIDHYDGN